jgi:hypothetical protein
MCRSDPKYRIKDLSEYQAFARGLHSRKQIEEGLARLKDNLDGRWHMKNHEFDMGYWKYDFEIDKWSWIPEDAEAGKRRIEELKSRRENRAGAAKMRVEIRDEFLTAQSI